MLLCACVYGVKSEISLDTSRDPSIQTEDISIPKQRVVWKCVKIILLYYYVEGRRFSDETGFILKYIY